ncbi:MAG: PIN domain-containing protein [Planctomycetota bacterium]
MNVVDSSAWLEYFSIPMADSIILATAKSHTATLWTQDEHFKKMAGVKFRQKK